MEHRGLVPLETAELMREAINCNQLQSIAINCNHLGLETRER